ncbi:MAG: hypothetical protein J0I41_01230 [Filimonas sp.]|nr:hypothetical protein [Filimonas sp.]
MSIQIIGIIVFVVVVYAGIFIWWKKKRSQTDAAFNKLDMKQEAANAVSYQNDLLSNQYSFIKKQMNGTPIDAFTVAQLEYGAKDQAKDIAKDALKSFASLGTVKFQTVQTPKYLILSGDELHLLDTDTDGDISKHLIFDNTRLRNSVITERPLPKTTMGMAKYGNYNLKSYIISLETEGKTANILVYNGIVATAATGVASALSNNTDLQVKQFVTGSYFLKKLGEKVPNLEVQTYLS